MRRAAALLAAALLALALASPARAAAPAAPATAGPGLLVPPTLDRPPPGRRLSARRAIAIARRVARIQGAVRSHPAAAPYAYLKGPLRWQVSWIVARPRREIAQVIVDDPTGRPLEAWTGAQVAWSMARGYPGAFGRKADAWWVWVPLCLLFVAPFVDRRRPLRLLHLDLLALVALSVSLAFFNHGRIGVSVPLVYPVLVYLLVRMLALGRRAPDPPRPLRLSVPRSWLAVGVVFLVAFRVGLNLTNSNVIDVGYAGVIGAHRLVEGQPLYGHFPPDNQHGDTYGPVNYYAYVPAERLLGWSGRWDDLPAAHATALAFDLLTALGLWLLGRRLRGPTMGLALAYAWVSFPFTLFASNANANDSLVALLVVGALLAAGSPARRGALVGLAGLTKFAPLALAPLMLRTPGPPRGRSRRGPAVFALALAAACAAALAPVALGGGLHAFWERTVAFQERRGSPFSVWGQVGGLHALQVAVQAGAVALALALAVWPRRRGPVQVAALAAAVLIAVQLGVTHWFYLYVVWFFAPAAVALLARHGEPEPAARRG